MQPPAHYRDPADWNENSYSVDLADEVDSIEDKLSEDAAAFWKAIGVPANRTALVRHTARFAFKVISAHTGQRTGSKEAHEMAARILATVIDSGKDAELMAKCIDFAVGMNVQGPITEQEIADQHGVTRAAVSKRCIQVTEEFAIPPSAGMRSVKTRLRHRLRQRGRRTVLYKETWGFSGVLKSAVNV